MAVKFKTTPEGERKTIIFSATPNKKYVFENTGRKMNRSQRRGLLYHGKEQTKRLTDSIWKLHRDLTDIDIKAPRPKKGRLKYLSGYWSRLLNIARAAVAE